MKKRLTHINPFDAGKMAGALGALYAIFALLFLLVTFGIGMVSNHYHGLAPVGADSVVLLLVALLGGFVYGAVGALIYNLLAKWTGGIQFTLADESPREVPPWPAALPRYPFAPR